MGIARFNFSHGSHEAHQEVLDRYRKVSAEVLFPCICRFLRLPTGFPRTLPSAATSTVRTTLEGLLLVFSGTKPVIFRHDVPSSVFLFINVVFSVSVNQGYSELHVVCVQFRYNVTPRYIDLL